MKYFIILITIFFASQSNADNIDRAAEYNCLKRVKSTLAPYINLPEYSAHFTQRQINEVDGLNALSWDVVDGDRTTRYFATEKGNFQCTFDSNLSDRAILNPEVFNSLEPGYISGRIPNLMVTTGYSLRSLAATQYTFSCTQQRVYRGTSSANQTHTSVGLIDHYLSWSPQLYRENLIANGTTHRGRPNTPGQFMFNISQNCWEVIGLDSQILKREIDARKVSMDRIYESFSDGGGSGAPASVTDPASSGSINE